LTCSVRLGRYRATDVSVGMRHEHSEVWGRSGFFGKLAATNSLLTIPKIVTRSPNTNLKLHHPITEDLHER